MFTLHVERPQDLVPRIHVSQLCLTALCFSALLGLVLPITPTLTLNPSFKNVSLLPVICLLDHKCFKTLSRAWKRMLNHQVSCIISISVKSSRHELDDHDSLYNLPLRTRQVGKLKALPALWTCLLKEFYYFLSSNKATDHFFTFLIIYNLF